MADFNQVDGVVQPAETFSGDLDFFTITIGGSFTGGDSNSATMVANGAAGVDSVGVPKSHPSMLLSLIVEVISQKGQPIILALSSSTVLNIVVEHSTMWTEAGASDSKAESLATAFQVVLDAFADDSGATQFNSVTTAVVFAETI